MVEVDGKSLRLTHLSKVMFPDDGFTKAELLLYYQTVAPLLLPHLRGRPLTLKAFPHGVKERPYYIDGLEVAPYENPDSFDRFGLLLK